MNGNFRDGGPDWRRFESMARRNWRRFANFANEDLGQWGGNFRVGRMLAAGDLRLVALYLIEQQSRHGYDLIKAVEERSKGFYTPSPGIVYPALTYLEEAGYVTSSAEGNKKLYTITDEGRTHLGENREAVEKTLEWLSAAGEQMNRFREFAKADWAGFSRDQEQKFDEMDRPGWPFGGRGSESPGAPRPHADEAADRDLEDVLPEVNEARRELKAAIKKARRSTPERQHRLAEIMRQAAADIRAIGREDDEVDI